MMETFDNRVARLSPAERYRIAAIFACDGISVEELEGLGTGGLAQQRDALLAACQAARGDAKRFGLFDLGISLRNNELDYNDGPGVITIRARADTILRKIDAAIARRPE